MKAILRFLLLLCTLHFTVNSVAADVQEEKVINVSLEKKDSDKTSEHPRTLLPISCVYVDGTIQLTLLENLGEMELFVTNQTTGEQWKAVNSLVLETSTESGVYWVEIVTENGGTYYGTYTL